MTKNRVLTFIFILALLFSAALPSFAQEGFLGQADTDPGATATGTSVSENTAASSSAASSSSPAASEESPSQSEFPWQGRVTATVLNARTAPMGTIVGSFRQGEIVTVKSRSQQNSLWLNVTGSAGSVCVHGAYISKTGGAASTPSNSSSSGSEFPFTGTVTASSLNARQTPWGTKVTAFNRGQTVTVTGRSDSDSKWYAVSHSGGTVYCHSSYISKGGSAATSGSTAGTTSGAAPATNQNTGDLSRDILSSIASMEMQSLTYPSPCGKTVNGQYYPGWLGCAYAVSTALNMAGVSSYSLGVDDLSNQLQRQPSPGFTRVATSSRQPGDIVIWNPSHIGVIKGNGRAYSNSSSNGCVREHSDTYMGIRFVLRAPA